MIKLSLIKHARWIILLAVFGSAFGVSPVIAATPYPADDIEVLASGPIHEAFAQAVVLDPDPGIVVRKEPPAMINEVPSQQKPEGDAQWIPGYWAWDDDMTEYIWVSGIWRIPPPGRYWVPGYWSLVTDGYQWIPGYWALPGSDESAYLPEPPESVEAGPNSNAPSSDYVWIPGSWVWGYDRYAWRPGYWNLVDPAWIWVPAYYIRTSGGYLFIEGYQDYPVVNRGILFSPVYFHHRSYSGTSYWFSPRYLIDLNIFEDSLFLRPRYHHYYYGNYHASRYRNIGIYPWFSVHSKHVVYDPVYARQRWHHRHDRDWEKRVEKKFNEHNDKKRRSPEKFERPERSEKRVESPEHNRYQGEEDARQNIKDANTVPQHKQEKEADRKSDLNRKPEIHQKQYRHRETPEQENSRESGTKGQDRSGESLPEVHRNVRPNRNKVDTIHKEDQNERNVKENRVIEKSETASDRKNEGSIRHKVGDNQTDLKGNSRKTGNEIKTREDGTKERSRSDESLKKFHRNDRPNPKDVDHFNQEDKSEGDVKENRAHQKNETASGRNNEEPVRQKMEDKSPELTGNPEQTGNEIRFREDRGYESGNGAAPVDGKFNRRHWERK